MSGRIIDAEIVEERPPESRIVQIDPQLEIERQRTIQSRLATERTQKRWGAFATMVGFVSLAQMCNPW